ncbi:diacylglycerol O-acyltransferase [Streptomyces chrestomyceticus JCM 4735]|uniref:diacylglycerol O-acyltransferase n=2 Tax=Streptomyces TaxID=1883 RepID=A0A7U9KVP5_9ACTN|nr:wax ester/triacylglycerol synthase domain-containing protein [Streptomyces chrestomyceticus]GCD35656.1 diacylglycerol O-acyltransferase [Streptomyces chrestomyceticus JCM 4735]
MTTTTAHRLRATASGTDIMSSKDHLTWRVESGTRAKPIIVAVMFLEDRLPWEQFVAWHGHLCAGMPRMQARVHEPPTAFRRPHWDPDPDFRLEHHLHHITVGGKGTRRDVLDTAATLAEIPFCQNRSPWNGYLIDGLDDGRSAYMLKISHSIADGVRLREMFLRQAAAQQPAPPPAPPATTGPATASERRIARPVAMARRLRKAAQFAAQALTDIRDRPYPVPPKKTRFARRYYTTKVPTAPFKDVAVAGGGTVHDALVAAVAHGCHRYHQARDIQRPRLRVFSPYARPPLTGQRPFAPMGNHWFIVRFTLRADQPDARRRISEVRTAVQGAYHRDAADWMGAVARISPLLPLRWFETGFLRLCASHDFGISNMPGPRTPLSVGGVRAQEIYAIAPVMGFAVAVTLLSYRDHCHVTVNIDPDVIADPDLLAQHIHDSLGDLATSAEHHPGRT